MNIGIKIRRLRLQRGLTQAELADRCELSKSFISLLERDLTSPSLDTLSDLLETLGCDLPTFFAKADEKIVFGAEDIFVKEDPEGLRGVIKWLIPSAQKNQMEPILLEMAPGGETDEDDPHEGEEFGYVLSGTIRVVLGDRSERVRRDESFCFRPNAPHKLVNAGKSTCRVLWVSTPPSF
ncbi:MAG: helix-turn-helix transcriptional regulator [Clostridia bacterium]|nr:helix-turn-helix transcriptional regulator [Clostridia bacterium]